MHPLIVTYYTPGTAYETNARALAEDVRALRLEARIEPLPARASWVENCAQKAGFIRNMHRAEGRPLLWLDADARLRRPIAALAGISADFAIARDRNWAFNSAQIYFGAGGPAARLLDIWCDYCARFPEIWDQVSLGYAWWELSLKERLEVRWLKQTGLYRKSPRNWRERLVQRLTPAPPILQRQESRRSKAGQAAPARPEFGMDEVPLWWRRAAARNAPFPLDAAQRAELGLA